MNGLWHRICGRIHIITGLFVQERIISAGKEVEFVSDT
jgi:hypothetical protein